MIDETTVRTKLREWIAKRSKSPLAPTDDTRLLESGMLRSLDIVELVLFLESLRGDEIDADAIEPDAFTSIETIWQAFFGEPRYPMAESAE